MNSALKNLLRTHPLRTIGTSFGLVALLMVTLIVTTMIRLGNIRGELEAIVGNHSVKSILTYQMYHTARERTGLLTKIIHDSDPFARDLDIIQFDQLGAEFGHARQNLIQMDPTPAEQQLLEQQRLATIETLAAQQKVVDLVQSGDTRGAAHHLLSDVIPAQAEVFKALNSLIDLQAQETHLAAERAYQQEREANLFLAGGGAAAILLSLAIAYFVHRRMTGLVSRLSAITSVLELNLRELEFQKIALDKHAIVSIADASGKIIYANDLFMKISQYSMQELIGQDHRILNSGYHPKAFFDEMWQTISSGQTWHGQVRNRAKDGSFYWVATTIVPFLDEQGKPYQYVSIRTEYTAIKAAEEVLQRDKEELERIVQERTAELREREEVLSRITGAAQDAIVMIDDKGLVIYWNAAAESIFGYSQADAMGRNLHDILMPPSYRSQHDQRFGHFAATGEGDLIGKTTELVALKRDGSDLPIELSLSAVQIKGKWCGIGIARDISERKHLQAQLEQLATTDVLTGIANRRKFNEVIAAEVKRAERHDIPLTLLMLDIDHFKSVNDTHGHQVGDEVLIETTRLISAHIRSYDFFARWGGEEFVILATHCDAHCMQRFAEKLRALVETHEFPTVGHLTCSFGLSDLRPGDSIDALTTRADQALYTAKEGGRNRVAEL